MKEIAVEKGWNFDNSYLGLPEQFFTRLDPTPVASPALVILNEPLAEKLGLDSDALKSQAGVALLAGNRIPPGAAPLAQAYAGHQFGYFTMLGDGRAHLLGEQITPAGTRVDVQLKGSGPTPYSRGGDGRAALGPMLREYIISAAMAGLGIPTTRSLAVVTTGESVWREIPLPGAVLTRIAASHLRVGTFQYAARWSGKGGLQALADYALARHFPDAESADEPYLLLLHKVIEGQARLIAQWQLVGFIHGVMNTDNMAISGETIDYGPCAFMDRYDPATVFSSIDRRGRYAYGNQPRIGAWNLAKFAETLLPLLDDDEAKASAKVESALEDFAELYHCQWLTGMRAKLGLFNQEEDDEKLITALLDLMARHKADYTNTFTALTSGEPESTPLFDCKDFAAWRRRWQARLARQAQVPVEVRRLMKAANPAVIPRNHRVEEVLAAAVAGDYQVMEKLLAALAEPYAHAPEQAPYTLSPPVTEKPYVTFCGT